MIKIKNSNGFGSVYKLSGKRRKPWRAVVTSGWAIDANGNAVQKRSTIGYFATRKEANIALAEYNKQPYDLNNAEITYSQVYELWKEEHYPTIALNTQKLYTNAYKHTAPLYDAKIKELKAFHLESILTDEDITLATRSHIKSLFNQMYKFADKNDLVAKNYAALIDGIALSTKAKRVIYTDQEIDSMFEMGTDHYAHLFLIAIYTGMRPTELLELTLDMINLDEWTIQHGIKTEAGRNRIIPIHTRIRPLILDQIELVKSHGYEQLFIYKNKYNIWRGLYYFKYLELFHDFCCVQGVKRVPYDCRHTFVTRLKQANADEYCIKRMTGHAIKDITEGIYTHRDIENLRAELEKVK